MTLNALYTTTIEMVSNQESDIIPNFLLATMYCVCFIIYSLRTCRAIQFQTSLLLLKVLHIIMNLHMHAALNQWITIYSIHGSLADCR